MEGFTKEKKIMNDTVTTWEARTKYTPTDFEKRLGKEIDAEGQGRGLSSAKDVFAISVGFRGFLLIGLIHQFAEQIIYRLRIGKLKYREPFVVLRSIELGKLDDEVELWVNKTCAQISFDTNEDPAGMLVHNILNEYKVCGYTIEPGPTPQ
jgi:hypothetical protein